MRRQTRYGIAALFEQNSSGPVQVLHEHRQRLVRCVDRRKHLHSTVPLIGCISKVDIYRRSLVLPERTVGPADFQRCAELRCSRHSSLAYSHAERNFMSGYDSDVFKHAYKCASNCTSHRQSHSFVRWS